MKHNNFFKSSETCIKGTSFEVQEFLDQIPFNEAGLVPVIAQQFDSKEVLMLAWMNRKAILKTLESGEVTYWSRSRQEYWVKGKTSGHMQYLKEMRADCDGDALLCLVDQRGAACHTLRNSCFFYQFDSDKQSFTIMSDIPK
jgi:phosphoribosyl-AMP cyclohydrolase